MGCATTQDIPTDDRTRTYDVPKDDLITASVDAFTAEGYTIEDLDRETGLVTTGEQSNSTMAAAFVGDQSKSMQAMVREAADGTRLTLTITWERENAFGQSSSQSIGKDAAMELYEEWFKKVEAQLE